MCSNRRDARSRNVSFYANGRDTTNSRHRATRHFMPIQSRLGSAAVRSRAVSVLPCHPAAVRFQPIEKVKRLHARASRAAESIFPASGWVVRDKRLDVVSGHRTSVDKGSHD